MHLQSNLDPITPSHSFIHSICICNFWEREWTQIKSLWDNLWSDENICKLIDGETLQWSSFIESLASHYRKTNGVWSFGLWFVCFGSIPTSNRRLNWSLSFSESLHIYPFFEFLYLTPWMSWQCYPSHVLQYFAFVFVFTVFVPISPLIGNPIIYYTALSVENRKFLKHHDCPMAVLCNVFTKIRGNFSVWENGPFVLFQCVHFVRKWIAST